jgi:prepilin-type N-terminal cleavage/methylation domain-containing protein
VFPVRPNFFPSISKQGGFTLIELLIVIAIILILIAIALPNFLDAQIRARVVRAKGELRTLAIAMESYHLDWKYYPSFSFPNYTTAYLGRINAGLTWLTSPNAYIKSLPEDPFPGDQGPGGHPIGGAGHEGPFSYILDGVQTPRFEYLSHPDGNAGLLKAWCIYSLGPDRPVAEVRANHNANPVCNNGEPIFTYAPTNGTKSKGDLMKYGGDPWWMGVIVDDCIVAIDGEIRGRYADPSRQPGQPVNDIRYLHRFPPD